VPAHFCLADAQRLSLTRKGQGLRQGAVPHSGGLPDATPVHCCGDTLLRGGRW